MKKYVELEMMVSDRYFYDGINSFKYDWAIGSFVSEAGDRYSRELVERDQNVSALVKYGHGYDPYCHIGRLIKHGEILCNIHPEQIVRT